MEGLHEAMQRLAGRMDETPTTIRPYQLAPQAAKKLNECARKDCRYCSGSGVRQWKGGGKRPIICKCARPQWLVITGQSEISPPPGIVKG